MPAEVFQVYSRPKKSVRISPGRSPSTVQSSRPVQATDLDICSVCGSGCELRQPSYVAKRHSASSTQPSHLFMMGAIVARAPEAVKAALDAPRDASPEVGGARGLALDGSPRARA